MSSYDVIVLGTGGVGSSALYHLARRGLRVLGIDRFPGGHDRGSSHGDTRIIRKAYFEHTDYVPLLERAYELWHELESQVGQSLYHETGLLEVGSPDGVVVPGVLASAAQHDLPIQQFTAAEATREFPGFAFPAGCCAVFEQAAGYLLVERCVLAHLACARQCGAELRHGEEVVDWTIDGTVTVRTDKRTYHADRLVVTGGAWASELLAGLAIELKVLRKHLHWYADSRQCYAEQDGCPAFFYEVPTGYYYGFPRRDERGIKVAEHSFGEAVDSPISVARQVDPQERSRVESFLEQCLPRISREPTDHCVCMYTMSPDDHFIVDQHPQHPEVVFAAGLSGHGFKFTSVLGEVLTDLAIDQSTPQPVEFLRRTRFDEKTT